MESEIKIKKASRRMDLETRLGLIVFSAAVSGFMTSEVIGQISQRNYGKAVLIGLFDVVDVIATYYHSRKAIEDYKK